MGTVDRQPKIDGDEKMMSAHKSISTRDARPANAWLHGTTNHFGCNKKTASKFSIQKYLMDLEC